MPRYDAASAFQLVYIVWRQESSPQFQYDKKRCTTHFFLAIRNAYYFVFGFKCFKLFSVINELFDLLEELKKL